MPWYPPATSPLLARGTVHREVKARDSLRQGAPWHTHWVTLGAYWPTGTTERWLAKHVATLICRDTALLVIPIE